MAPLWLDVLDETARMCATYGRVDLVDWLRRRRVQMLDPQLRVLVVGGAKQGKSQLINALVNAQVCVVGDDEATVVPTVVRHAATPSAALVRRTLNGADGPRLPAVPSAPQGDPDGDWPLAHWAAVAAGPEERVPVPVQAITGGFGELARERFGRSMDLVHAEIGLPRSLLASGITLIDTPALPRGPAGDGPVAGGGGSTGDRPGPGRRAGRADGSYADRGGNSHRAALTSRTTPVGRADGAVAAAGSATLTADVPALAAYAGADLVMLACDATRDLSPAELAVLTDLGELYPATVIALTKIDFAPDWRRTLLRHRQCLADAGVAATVLPVSAALRLHATRADDKQLNVESGFPQLITYLQQAIAAKPDELARAGVGLLGRIVVKQLAAPLRRDLAEQSDGGPSEAMARLHEAQRRVDELRRCATRWQNVLADEVGDLMSDIEQDLRDRTRAILRKVDDAFDDVDPLRAWDNFERWLTRALREAAEASFSWLIERTEWLATQVAAQLPADAAAALPRWTLPVLEDLLDRVTGLNGPSIERFTASQKLFTALRGSYGGVLMMGLATSLAGMPLINPISVGAGALLGGKSIRDESKSMLKRRQATAKVAVQRHVDEVFVRLNKDAKDTIRQVQRVLRDHFTGVTEDFQDSIVESLRSAKRAADHDAAAREQKLRRIQHELSRLAELYERAQELTRTTAVAIPGQREPVE